MRVLGRGGKSGRRTAAEGAGVGHFAAGAALLPDHDLDAQPEHPPTHNAISAGHPPGQAVKQRKRYSRLVLVAELQIAGVSFLAEVLVEQLARALRSRLPESLVRLLAPLEA